MTLAELNNECKNYTQSEYRFQELKEEYASKIRAEVIDECINTIDDEYYDGGYGDYHEVLMIVRMLKGLKEQK